MSTAHIVFLVLSQERLLLQIMKSVQNRFLFCLEYFLVLDLRNSNLNFLFTLISL
jgi:hypothetical protein